MELHPLDRDKLAQHTSFTLHSITGQRTGNDLVFGCQRFPMSVVADAHGTMQFLADGQVQVTMPATARGGYVHVGDRDLGISDINAYTTSIISDGMVVDPDREVKETIARITRNGTFERAGEILTSLRAAGFDVVKRDV